MGGFELLVFGWDSELELFYLGLDHFEDVSVAGEGRYLLELSALFLV